MASQSIARKMITKIDEMQAMTEEARGSIEKQLTDLRDAMVADVGAEQFAAFINDFRGVNDLLATSRMQGADSRSILQATRKDLVKHYRTVHMVELDAREQGGRRRRRTRVRRHKRRSTRRRT
jgi:hypothetical protein